MPGGCLAPDRDLLGILPRPPTAVSQKQRLECVKRGKGFRRLSPSSPALSVPFQVIIGTGERRRHDCVGAAWARALSRA